MPISLNNLFAAPHLAGYAGSLRDSLKTGRPQLASLRQSVRLIRF